VARTVTAAFAVLLLVSTCIAEHRFQSGPYAGFTKLPQEQVIVELPKPLHIREVSGTVLAVKGREPVRKALFELRDDATGKVGGLHSVRHSVENCIDRCVTRPGAAVTGHYVQLSR